MTDTVASHTCSVAMVGDWIWRQTLWHNLISYLWQVDNTVPTVHEESMAAEFVVQALQRWVIWCHKLALFCLVAYVIQHLSYKQVYCNDYGDISIAFLMNSRLSSLRIINKKSHKDAYKMTDTVASHRCSAAMVGDWIWRQTQWHNLISYLWLVDNTVPTVQEENMAAEFVSTGTPTVSHLVPHCSATMVGDWIWRQTQWHYITSLWMNLSVFTYALNYRWFEQCISTEARKGHIQNFFLLHSNVILLRGNVILYRSHVTASHSMVISTFAREDYVRT